MPFGKKADPTSRVEIDFDDLYRRVVGPSAEAAALDVLRADEEVQGGFIHVAMYERLLLAEIVLADLTLSNPNVFYELGIRHAARPRATILIFSKGYGLPFDVAPIRAIPYALEGSVVGDAEAERLKDDLTKRLISARDDRELTDSPLFQLVKDYPGIELPHEATVSFRDRVKLVLEWREHIAEALRIGNQAAKIERLQELQRSLVEVSRAPVEILLDLLLGYRGASGWEEMVRLYDLFPVEVQRAVPVREQVALALNRRNADGDRQRAISILKDIINVQGASPKTCGIMGRVYKDSYAEFLEAGKTKLAQVSLDDAIEWYEKGFDADPRNCYPGINLTTLLVRRGREGDLKRVEELKHVVAFAVNRRGGPNSDVYWDVATVLELSVIGEDWPTALSAAARAATMDVAPWMIETTERNLMILRKVRQDASRSTKELDEVVETLKTNLAA